MAEQTNGQSRVSTGISGLDHILRGGLPRSRLYLVDGRPGTGKTTLALQFLLEGVARGERVLYISLAETKPEILAVAASHGWSLDQVVIYELPALRNLRDQRGEYTLLYPSDVELGGTVEAIIEELERVRPDRVALDSLSELRLTAQDALRYRRQVLALKQYFSESGSTVLMLDDLHDAAGHHLDTLAHGVVRLERLAMEYGPHRRRLEVAKMREVDFRAGYHDLAIRRGGLEVFPRMVSAEHGRKFEQRLVSSGLPNLDKLLGGGVHAGTSTVITGPSGAGKTTLTTQYALAAAERGEHAAIYIFDENLFTFYTRARGLGMDIERHVREGRIEVTQMDAATISPGEFAQNVRRTVERDESTIVVVDSLNGYLHSMPDERFLILQVHELFQYLSAMGVVTMVVLGQRGLTHGSADPPFDLSYLVDTVLTLKYFECDGAVRRAVSVFKKRPGDHELILREFTMGKEGIRIGEPNRRLHGILSHTPQYVGAGGEDDRDDDAGDQ